MKNPTTKLLSFLFALIIFHSLSAQNDWTTYQLQDGLSSNNVLLSYPESANKIWLVSDSGLSLIQNQMISNYPKSSSAMPSNVINDLEVAFNKLWMATDSGLVSFDGNSFLLINNPAIFTSKSINALTKTSNGELWIGSDSEAVRYNGNTYNRYANIRCEMMFRDSADRVYANARSNFIINFPSSGNPAFNSLQVFENGSWNVHNVANPQNPSSFSIWNIKDIEEKDGRVFFLRGQDTLSEFTYQNGIQTLFVIDDGRPNNNLSRFTLKDSLYYVMEPSRLFNGLDSSANEIYFSTQSYYDSVFSPIQNQWLYFMSSTGTPNFNDLSNDGNKVYISTQQGLYVSDMVSKQIQNQGVTLETNAIRTQINNRSSLFGNSNSNSGNFEFPKDSNSFGIYSAALILVAGSPQFNGLRRINNFIPFNGNNLGPAGGGPYHLRSIHKLSRQEIQNHRANYQNPAYTMPYSIAFWPANADSSMGQPLDLAPFFDANNNGCYDPGNGDYPIIKGDEAIYWIIHFDVRDAVVEYHYMLYASSSISVPEVNYCQFLDVRIVNRGNNDLTNVKAGFQLDCDLGAPFDDYAGSDSSNQISYFYNGDNFDESFSGNSGFGSNSPALGVKFLSDSMIGSINYYPAGSFNGTPGIISGLNNYLMAQWLDGSPITYGGNGFDQNTTTIPTKFMFTGDPLAGTGWIEGTASSGGNPTSPGDRRVLSIIEPFNLFAGASKTISFAIGYGRKSSVIQHEENIGEMINVLNTAKAYWDTISSPQISYSQNFNCQLITQIEEQEVEESSQLKIYPNPTKGELNIRSKARLQWMQLYSSTGRLVTDRRINQSELQIDLNGLDKGVYFIRLQSEDGKWLSEKLILQ